MSHLAWITQIAVLEGGYVVVSLGSENSMSFLRNEVWGAVAAALLVWVAWKLPKSEV